MDRNHSYAKGYQKVHWRGSQLGATLPVESPGQLKIVDGLPDRLSVPKVLELLDTRGEARHFKGLKMPRSSRPPTSRNYPTVRG